MTTPSKKLAKRTAFFNPVVASIVAITMMLALVVTVLPGVANPGGAGTRPSADGRQVIDNSTQQRITQLEGLLKNSPKDTGILTQLGNEYYDTGQYPKAIEFYSQVLDQTPNDTNVRTDMATAYLYSGMASNAIREYKKALEAEPNKQQTLFNLGVAYSEANPPEIDNAVAQWQKVIQLYPGTDDAKKAQDFINKNQK